MSMRGFLSRAVQQAADELNAAATKPPAAPSEPNQHWTILVYNAKMYIPATVRTPRGVKMSNGVAAVIDARDSVAVTVAIEAEVAKDIPVVPEPDWSSFKPDTSPNVLNSAGVRNYVGFFGWAVTRQAGKFYTLRLIMDPQGMGIPRVTSKDTAYSDAANAARVIATEIVESLVPGQTKYIPAKSSAKPKPAKRATTQKARPRKVPPIPPNALTIEQLAATNHKARRPTKAQVAKFEATLPEPLPEDYRRFLLLCNGEIDGEKLNDEDESNIVNAFFTVIPPNSSESIADNQRVYQDPDSLRISEEVLPIAFGICGDVICLGLTGKHRGKVFFWDHENEPILDEWDGTVDDSGNMEELAPSFAHFVATMSLA